LRFVSRALLSGSVASIASALAGVVCSRIENRHAARPINAITHIFDGGHPPPHDGPNGRNTALGFTIHTGASIFWAVFYETLLGCHARESSAKAIGSGAAIAATAYFVDYYVVHRRFRPGFEHYLSRRSLFCVYAALAAGFAAAAMLTRSSPARGAPRARRPQPCVRRRAAGSA